MKILTHYNREDNFSPDRSERWSNSCLGLLRTVIGKTVTVRLTEAGEIETTPFEYASTKEKVKAVFIGVLLLPITAFITIIGIITYLFSKTHGQILEKESPPVDEPKSPPKAPPSSPKTPESPATPISPERSPERPVLKVMVELNNQDFYRLDEDKFLELLETRGKEIVNLSMNRTTINLSALIPQIPNVEKLIFNECNFGDNGLKGFEKGLEKLSTLDLRRCNLTSDDLLPLNQADLKSLKKLDLSYNWIDDEAIPYILFAIRNAKLYTLYLSDNQIGSNGASLLANSNTLYNLDELDLNDNSIEDEGYKNIAYSRELANLTTLHIVSQLATCAGILHLAHSSYLGNLETLAIAEGSVIELQKEKLMAKYKTVIFAIQR